MPVFQTTRQVRHSADRMFDLVADVERYPEFVPLCQALRVRSRVPQGDTEIVTADMTVAYKIFRETFRSRVVLDRPHGRILVEYLEGPLGKLENRWTFRPLDAGSCEVGFYLSYEFASRTLAALMGAVFDAAFRRFAEAFERRADAVYGRERSPA